MRESILTIPVTDIFDPKCGCPICRLRDTLEQRTVVHNGSGYDGARRAYGDQ